MTLPAATLTSRARWTNSFIGFISKDINPPSQTYTAGQFHLLDLDGTVKETASSPSNFTTATLDMGDDAYHYPVRLRVPANPTGDVDIAWFWTDHDGTNRGASSAGDISAMNETFQSLFDLFHGGATDAAAANGAALKSFSVYVEEESGSDTTTDVDTIRIRSMAFLRGSGAAL